MMDDIQNTLSVSIGLPVYNGERFLRRALDSLLAQDFRDFELIISDNASTDSTREICETYAANDDRIRYFRNDMNLGAIKNYEQTLELARGKYFMWAAYDDLWEPGFLSNLLETFKRNPDAILAFCSCDRIDTEGEFIHAHRKYGRLDHANTLMRANRYIWFPDGEGRVMVIYGLMRASALKELGDIQIYSPEVCSDDMLVLKFILRGNFVFVDKLLFHKRDVPESPSFTKFDFRERCSYYWNYRSVVLESDLSYWKKLILVVSITVRQVVFEFGKPPYRLFLSIQKRILARNSS